MFNCYTTDISEGGLRLETDRALPVDTQLELRLTLLEREFVLGGSVIWSGLVAGQEAIAGVYFHAEDMERLWPWKIQVARAFRSED